MESSNEIIEKISIDRIVSSNTNIQNIICKNCKCLLTLSGCEVCGECKKSFCNFCKPSNNLCMYCKKKTSHLPLSPSIYNELDNLLITCKNEHEGCSENLSYKDVFSHEKQCKYNKIKCDCGKILYMKDYNTHYGKCDELIIQCPQCYYKAKRNNFKHNCEVYNFYTTFSNVDNNLKPDIILDIIQIYRKGLIELKELQEIDNKGEGNKNIDTQYDIFIKNVYNILEEGIEINNIFNNENQIDANRNNPDYQYLQDELKNVKNNTIALENQNIGPDGAKLIAEFIKGNKITSIEIKDNFIGPKGISYLSDALSNNQYIQMFSLGNNKIGLSGAKDIENLITSNTSLEWLFIDNNGIGCGVKYIAEGLRLNNTLSRIGLNKNNIGVEGAKYLGEALKVNKSIEWLYLDYNNIGSEGCRFLCEGLKNSNSIKRIMMSDNNIGPDGAKHLGELLEVNKSISLICMDNNIVRNEGAKYLVDSLQHNDTIVEIHLTNNKIEISILDERILFE